jgi:glycosyltransferase involved in cell wall biosynthesis
MLKNNPLKVSIITVCYNSEQTLEETINSVISQDYADIEYIIVDGKSKDKTMAIVEKYDQYISKKISDTDKGIYDAMNKGINIATGDIIGILNSDDLFTKNSIISEVVNTFNANSGVDAVYGNLTYFKNEDKNKVVRTWITKDYYDGFFSHGEVPPHPSLFVRSKVYKEIGTYFPDFKISSDYEFMLRAFKVHQYKPLHLNRFVVNMRMGGESTKNFSNILVGNKEISLAWKMNNIRPPFYFWFFRIIKKLLQYGKR